MMNAHNDDWLQPGEAAHMLALSIIGWRREPDGTYGQDDDEFRTLLCDVLIAVCNVAIIAENILGELRAIRQVTE